MESNSHSATDEVLVSKKGKRKQKGYLPTELVKIFHVWLYEHRFKAYRSKVEKCMLTEQISLSFPQFSNWFINARRRFLPEMLLEDVSDPNQVTIYHQKGSAADVTHQQGGYLSIDAKSGLRAADKIKCLSLSPSLMIQGSGKLPNLELVPGQRLTPKAQISEKVVIFTSGPLLIPSPKPVVTGEYKDFSSFQRLVDAAVQQSAELELQIKKSPSHDFPHLKKSQPPKPAKPVRVPAVELDITVTAKARKVPEAMDKMLLVQSQPQRWPLPPVCDRHRLLSTPC
nr:homeobox protein TGIF2LX-like [Odocoileus virginianus texanus]